MAPRRPPIRQGTVLPCYSYLRDDRDFALSDSLKAWRNAVATARYGEGHVSMFGAASLVLSDHALERIVDCAHFYRLQSPVDLLVETQWVEALAMAEDILGLNKTGLYRHPKINRLRSHQVKDNICFKVCDITKPLYAPFDLQKVDRSQS